MSSFIEIIKDETDQKKWRRTVLRVNRPGNRRKRDLLIDLLSSKDTEYCLKAIKGVKLAGLADALVPLCVLLKHKSHLVRIEAARALGTVGRFKGRALTDEVLSAAPLSDITRDTYFGPLNEGLTPIEAMRQGGGSASLIALNGALLDPVVEVGIEASQAMAKIGGMAVWLLCGAARSENSVISAHGTFGLAMLKDEECMGELQILLEDKSAGIRAASAEALGGMRVNYESTRRAIRQAMMKEDDVAAQLAMAKALLRLGEDTLWMILPRFKSLSPIYRQAAADAAGWHPIKEVVKPLMVLLFDADSEVRRTAKDSLLRYKKAGLVKGLPQYEWFTEPEEVIREMRFDDGHTTTGQLEGL